jgi:diadenosine tetraphosphatase ApaH/serine/threonine PP2A family protein phosphatase
LGPDATPTGAVVNPGSVGDPYDADARYAVIDTADWSVDLAGVAYDTDPVRDEIEGHGESGSGSGSARQGGDGGRSPGHRDG